MRRVEGQLRAVAGAGGLVYTGADMASLLALADAQGVPPPVAADFLPDLAATAARKMNARDG